MVFASLTIGFDNKKNNVNLKSYPGMMIKLYVAGYPFDIEEIELLEIFCFYGTVHSISLIKEKSTGKHKGYGFIEMTDREGAERVIEAVNGLSIRGRVLTVKIADQPKGQGPRSTKNKPHKSNHHGKPYGKRNLVS